MNSLKFRGCVIGIGAMLMLLTLSCSKSSVDPDLPNYFIATVDGKEINFDNFVEAQMNIPKQVSLSNPYVFWVEGSKVSGSDSNLMYFFVNSQSPIQAMTYDNSIRPDDVWFWEGEVPPQRITAFLRDRKLPYHL